MPEFFYKVRCDKCKLMNPIHAYCEMCMIRNQLEEAIFLNRNVVQAEVSSLAICINEIRDICNKDTSAICKDISVLEDKIKDIEKNINEIDICELHRRSQIDTLANGIKDIEYRLSHIVELPSELDIRLQDVERKIDSLGRIFFKMRKEFESKLDIDYKKWGEYFSQIRPQKKPHKCPVCDGSSKIHTGLKFEEIYGTDLKTVISCHSCEGKGIVWG